MAANGNEAITLNQLKQFDSSGGGKYLAYWQHLHER